MAEFLFQLSFQILHFDCMRFGQDSVAFLKPEENGGLMGMEGEGEGGSQDTIVIYDPVYEIKVPMSQDKDLKIKK